MTEREDISRGIAASESCRRIARRLGLGLAEAKLALGWSPEQIAGWLPPARPFRSGAASRESP